MSSVNRMSLKELHAHTQQSALQHLKTYVRNRTDTYSNFHRLDPNSDATKDALRHLNKARHDYATFAAAIAADVDATLMGEITHDTDEPQGHSEAAG